jgi:hypothetical protein
MKILFDQGTPAPLRRHLPSHLVETVAEIGWSQVENGDLLRAAEQAAFEVFVTTDQNLQYQQNLASRRLAIVVLLSTSWPRMQSHLQRIQQAIDQIKPGEYVEIPID